MNWLPTILSYLFIIVATSVITIPPEMFVRSASSCVEVKPPKPRHAIYTQGRFHLRFVQQEERKKKLKGIQNVLRSFRFLFLKKSCEICLFLTNSTDLINSDQQF